MSLKTIIRKVDPADPDPETIALAGKILREGGLVAFPTETVYGLGGDALNASSSKKIYAAKGRPSDNPLIVHIADPDALGKVARDIPESAERLMKEFWPGPLTMIFRKTEAVPPETTGGLDTVAVRLPSHPAARALIRAAGGYIAAPSANLSGRPSTTDALHVREDLDGRIDMIIDGGESEVGLESTIVDFTEEVPVILRPGFINRDMLLTVLPEVRIDPGILTEDEHVRPKAPGMRYRHYAPKAPLVVVEGAAGDVIRAIRGYARKAAEEGKRAAVLCSEESAPEYAGGDESILVCPVGSLEEEDSIARHLYARLREFDAEGVDMIYSEAFDTPRLGQAIMNRLLKAAGHTVIRAE